MKDIKIGRINLRAKYFIFFILGILILIVSILFSHKKVLKESPYSIDFLNVNTEYADTTLKYLSNEEKVGQLIIADFGKAENVKTDSVIKLLYQILPGGIVYSTDSIFQFLNYQNIIQKYSKINPFVFLPEESGVFHFKETENLPNFNFLTAFENDSIKRNYMTVISKIAKQINLSSLFSDISSGNINDNDYKVLNSSDNRIAISQKLMSFANASQFLTDDSIRFELNSQLISEGLTGIILDEDENSDIIQKIKNEYNYEGLFLKRINSKLMNSDSVAIFINSGTDLFITKEPKKLKKILAEMIENELINNEILTASVRKILLAKTWTGLENNSRILKPDIDSLLKSPATLISENTVYRNSINLIKNKNNVLPFKNLKKAKFQILVTGNADLREFYKTFKTYYSVKSLFIDISDEYYIKKIKKIRKKNNLIIAMNSIKIDSALINAILEHNETQSLTLVNFGKPSNLNFTDSFSAVIQVFGNSEKEQHYAADAIFGGIPINSKYPYYIKNFKVSDSVVQIKKVRVSECLPEEIGLNALVLSKIDSIAKDGIRRGAFPGCQIVVLKNGYNVYNKSFGWHTYAKRRKVRNTDLYDLASVTKIAATTTAAMKLYSQGKIRLNDKLGRFFRNTKIDYSNIKPDTLINIDTLKIAEIRDFNKLLKFQDTLHINDSVLIAFDTLIVTTNPRNNIFQVKIRDLLLHKSGITPTLPILPYVIFKKNFYDSLEFIKQRFYENIQNDTSVKNKTIEFNARQELQKIYDTYFTKRYIKDSAEVKIADAFYLKNAWFDTLWRDTKRLRVYSRKIYQYSDINMILLQSAIDSLNRRSMNSYMRNTFYLPMGLNTMCYKPRRYFSLNRIVPTENDKYWREQLLRGNVHDPSAAMLGGISGNAGLFSDAYDLAVLGQMWLNGGSYGGMRFISESTVKKFTGFQEDSHRGLGFDKPHKKAIIGKGAATQSYGHTGFTGTCIWVDPENEIVFVFLSNRVNPSAKNWRINRLKIRQKIHTVVYDAMKTNNFN